MLYTIHMLLAMPCSPEGGVKCAWWVVVKCELPFNDGGGGVVENMYEGGKWACTFCTVGVPRCAECQALSRAGHGHVPVTVCVRPLLHSHETWETVCVRPLLHSHETWVSGCNLLFPQRSGGIQFVLIMKFDRRPGEGPEEEEGNRAEYVSCAAIMVPSGQLRLQQQST